MSFVDLLLRPTEAPSGPQEAIPTVDEDDTDKESERGFWRRMARLARMDEADPVEAVAS